MAGATQVTINVTLNGFTFTGPFVGQFIYIGVVENVLFPAAAGSTSVSVTIPVSVPPGPQSFDLFFSSGP